MHISPHISWQRRSLYTIRCKICQANVPMSPLCAHSHTHWGQMEILGIQHMYTHVSFVRANNWKSPDKIDQAKRQTERQQRQTERKREQQQGKEGDGGRRVGKAVRGMRIAMGQWQRRFTYSRHSGEDVVVHRGPLKLTSSALPKAHACDDNKRDWDRDRVLPTWDKKDD